MQNILQFQLKTHYFAIFSNLRRTIMKNYFQHLNSFKQNKGIGNNGITRNIHLKEAATVATRLDSTAGYGGAATAAISF